MKSRAVATQRRAERRRDRVNARAARRQKDASSGPSPEERALFERFKVAFIRWNAHRGGELHDNCPCCSRLVIIRPRVEPGASDGVFDASHVEPVCPEFVFVLMSMGAGDLRTTTRTRNVG